MASPRGASDSATRGDGIDTDDGFESESGSSYIGSDEPYRSPVPCRWRTPDFFDQECSRYFDCPSHIVERRLSTDDTLSERSDSAAGSTNATLERHDGESAARGSLDATPTLHTVLPLRVRPAPSELADEPAAEALRQGAAVPLPPSRPESSSASALTPMISRHASQGSQDESGRLQPVESSNLGNQDQEIEGYGRDEDPGSLPNPPESTRPSLSVQGREGSLVSPDFVRSGESSAVAPSASEQRGMQDFILPRWQPDASTTYCPICHSQFNIFVRKHHCRKCGRVVCNSCSPHRIIIPHQYIVRPPGTELPISASLLVEGLGAGFFGVNGPSGGERVRLCNPCVPDPNIAPPQSPSPSLRPSPRALSQRNRSSLGDAYGAAPQTNRYGAVFTNGPSSDPYRGYPHNSSRTRSITVAHGTQQPNIGTAGRRSSAIYRHQPRLERLLAGGSSSSASSSYPSRYSALEGRDNAPSPRYPPQLDDEDCCPICHRELPSSELSNSVALRESHIELCIQTHSTYGSPRVAGEDGPVVPPRRTGMYSYPATEKDCIDDAECTICLEEFTVGVPMARLECLCRFHRSCISAWFVNHPGRCPVHQHDGFGY